MALTAEQFAKSLISAGLSSADEIKTLWNALPAGTRPKDGETFARLLVERDRLTPFQAEELLAGSPTPLVLGDYVLLAKIGAGGMGQVFKAQHRHMDRLVAIKLLPTAMTKDAEAVKRFQREVKAAAKLSHANIVQAHDASVQRGVWYLVMEYVEGQDLAGLVAQQGPLPLAQAVDFIRQSAKGLAFAHGKGVVHRDIKPANLLLDREGTVKILDMGLARFEDGLAAKDGLTQSGQVMGTVDYMAPEQAFDTHSADARADIYSLGCTLYRLLTGQNMYAAESLVQKLMAHQHQPIPQLAKLRTDVPPALAAIFERMVAKKPEDRFQTMAEVESALDSLSGKIASSAKSLSSSGVASKSSDLAQAVSTLAPPDATGGLAPTVNLKGPLHGTDPISERSIQVARENTPHPAQGKRLPPWRKPPILIGAGLVGFLLLAGSLWVFFNRQEDPTKIARIDVPIGGSVSQTTETVASVPTGLDFRPYLPGETEHQHVELPPIVKPAGEYTVELFVRPRSAPKYGWSRQVFSASWQCELKQHFTNWNWTVCRTGTDFHFMPFSDAIPFGERAHIAIVSTGERQYAYVNGKIQGEYELPQDVRPADSPLGIGGPLLFTTDFNYESFDGTIEGCRISRSPRYQAVSFPPPASLEKDEDTLALYLFNEGQGNVLTDSSGNKHHGKIVGAQWMKAGQTPNANSNKPWHGWPSGAPNPAVAPFNNEEAKQYQKAWADYLMVPVEWKNNSLGMTFRLIPPGEFMMGSTPDEIAGALAQVGDNQHWQQCIASEGPRHAVVLTQPFYFGVHEVTQKQYEDLIGTNPSSYSSSGSLHEKVSGLDTSQHPVEGLRWADAADFCAKASEKDKLKPFYFRSGNVVSPLAVAGYRLPSEAEWEFACRAGTNSRFWSGDTEEALRSAGWYKGNSGERTHQVGELASNPFGLFDVHGNVEEWVNDTWSPDYYRQFEQQTAVDPQGPKPPQAKHINRGGAQFLGATYCRAAPRDAVEPDVGAHQHGMRIALPVEAVRQLLKVTGPPIPKSPAVP